MEYPKRLLPKLHYKKISWHEILKNFYLIHFTDSKDIKDPETEKLKLEHVVRRTGHLRDYSTNLLGIFLVDDIYWSLQNCEDGEYYKDEWVEGTKVKVPKVPDEFNRDETRGYFFLRIGDCHNEVVQFEDSATKYSHLVCKVLHTPTNANFWHFSLRWFFDEQELESWSKGVKRRMKTLGKTFIIERAFFEEPYYEEIGKEHYVRNQDQET